MKKLPLHLLCVWILLGSTSGCSTFSSVFKTSWKGVLPPPDALQIHESLLYRDTTWVGTIHIKQPVSVTVGATLTVLPGAVVYLDCPSSTDAESTGGELMVYGTILAQGSEHAPVWFVSTRENCREGTALVSARQARKAVFINANFRGGATGLSVNEGFAHIEQSQFTDFATGLYASGGTVEVKQNSFIDNRTGVELEDIQEPSITGNQFLDNNTGVLLQNRVRNPLVRKNHFDNVEVDLALGALQSDDVVADNNRWTGVAKGKPIDTLIFDARDGRGAGKVSVNLMLPLRGREFALKGKVPFPTLAP